MSATTQLPTKQLAVDSEALMSNDVFVPQFLAKLASHDFRPQTQEDVRKLLKQGAILAQRYRNGQYKTAAEKAQEQSNPFLDHALNLLGVQDPGDAFDDRTIQKMAEDYVANNDDALQASLIYRHMMSGGELADDDTNDE